MPETKEISFFKKLIISITSFERYPELASKRGVEVFKYLLKLMAIFTFIVVAISTHNIIKEINSAIIYLKQEIPNFTFKDNELKFDNEDKIQIKNEDTLIDNLIIDTRVLSNEEKDKNIEDIKKSINGVLILKDRIILKTGIVETGIIEYSYNEISQKYKIENFNKEDVVQYFSKSNIVLIAIGIFIISYIYMLLIYITSVLIDALVLGGLGYITALILRLRLKYTAMIKMAIHSLTLPIILNLIYIIIKTYTGFEIKYFEVMYIAIAYIYIIASILMIKSDIIKKGQELAKIIEEQEKIKREMEKQKEEERKELEDEKNKSKEKEEKEKNNKEKEDGNIGTEPQGDNA